MFVKSDDGWGMGGAGLGSHMFVDPNWTDQWMSLDPEEKEVEKPEPEEVRISVELIDGFEKIEAPGAHGDYSTKVLILTLPLLGRIHLLRNRTGVINVSIVVLYWIYGVWSTVFVILQPHYDEGHISGLPVLFYSAISILCISSLFRASTSNPGRIPFSREPPAASEQMTWNHCRVCKRRKPQKSHHCSRCQQCILRMDHHCPWINNCVGEGNHWMFIQLLGYAFSMGTTTLVYCMLHYYYWPPCENCDKQSFHLYHATAFTAVLIIMAVFMSIAMILMILNHLYSALSVYFICNYLWSLVACACCMAVIMMGLSMSLLMIQGMGLRRDMTTIDWMKLHNEWNKGSFDPSKIPAPTKPVLKALDDLCGPGPRWMWLFPCRKRRGPLQIKYPEVV